MLQSCWAAGLPNKVETQSYCNIRLRTKDSHQQEMLITRWETPVHQFIQAAAPAFLHTSYRNSLEQVHTVKLNKIHRH